MSHRNGYALSSLSDPASSGVSRLSTEVERGTPDQNPFADQTHEEQSLDPHNAYSANLSSGSPPRHRSHGLTFIAGWHWEIAAWLFAAISLFTLIVVFAVFKGKPLSQWKSSIAPSTVVAILSQFGQTAILAPVTACICQSMWLWLEMKGRAVQPAMSNGQTYPRLFHMQEYDDGSRGPLGSLLLLCKHPKS